MAVLSKLRELSLPYNCYEVGHTWTPACSEAALSVGYDCLVEGLKIYGPLYLISQAVQRKFTLKAFLRTIQSVYTSSFFLGFNGFAFIFIFCLLRNSMGKFYYLHCSYFPAFAASFLAILIERESRRGPLALYVTNVASETIFRMLVAREKIHPVENGEVYLFSMTMAVFLYVIRRQGFAKDFINVGLRYVIGEDEAKPIEEFSSSKPLSLVKPPCFTRASLKGHHSVQNVALACNGQQKVQTKSLWNFQKHESCPHKTSCFHYVLQGFLRPFSVGYAVYFAIRCLSAGSRVLQNPRLLLKLMTDNKTLNLGIFLGGFGGTFRLINCTLRWLFGRDNELYALPAAFLSGFFMKFFPSSSLSLYLAWKVIEVSYLVGIKEGVLPNVKGSMLFLYAASTAVLFYAAVLEPHNLKPAYLKFLTRLTKNKIGEINRHVLDIFGTHASKLYTHFWPELDLKYTSRVFQETVLLWLIH